MASIASGLFSGMPVGGSFSATAPSTNAGAQSRFSNIFAGIVMAVVIILFGPAVGYIAMPAMAGLLIVIGFRTFKPQRVERVWKTGAVQRVVMVITFIYCLLVPLQYAVLIGVVVSLLLYVLRQSNEVRIREWKQTDGPYLIEQDPPDTVPANEVVALMPYGSLFFAAAPLFEEQLPDVNDETKNSVILLNLRGYDNVGSTFLGVLEKYSDDLRVHQSKLMLAAVSPSVVSQLEKTRLIRKIGWENIYPATDQIGQPGAEAWEQAEKWVVDNQSVENAAA